MSPEESILYLLSHLYAQRSSPLWKSSGHASWLSSTANAVLPTLSGQRKHPIRDRFLRTFSSLTLRYSIYRHVFVLEQTHAQPQNRALTAFIPPDITQGRHLACDPLPSPSAISTYDTAFFVGAEDPFALGTTRSRRRTQAEERLLARLIPDAATRAQIVTFFDQNPWIAAQLPGGIVEFVQMIAEMPEDALHEMMIGAEMMREAGGAAGVQPGLADRGAMPGELLDEEVEVFLEAGDGGDDVDDVPHGQPGHQDGRADTEEDEDEEEEEEEEEVAVSITGHLSSISEFQSFSSRCLSVWYATSSIGSGEVALQLRKTRPTTAAVNEHNRSTFRISYTRSVETWLRVSMNTFRPTSRFFSFAATHKRPIITALHHAARVQPPSSPIRQPDTPPPQRAPSIRPTVSSTLPMRVSPRLATLRPARASPRSRPTSGAGLPSPGCCGVPAHDEAVARAPQGF